MWCCWLLLLRYFKTNNSCLQTKLKAQNETDLSWALFLATGYAHTPRYYVMEYKIFKVYIATCVNETTKQ